MRAEADEDQGSLPRLIRLKRSAIPKFWIGKSESSSRLDESKIICRMRGNWRGVAGVRTVTC